MTRFLWEMFRQDGTRVMSMSGWGMYRTRPAD
jgi:hypothetical protein